MFTRIQQKQSKQQCYEKFEAALKVERTVSVLTQGRPDIKRGAPSTSQPDLVSLVERKERSGPAVEAQDKE